MGGRDRSRDTQYLQGGPLKKVLIIGASSGIGLECVKEALRRGLVVRAFARSATEIDFSDPNLERCNGEALDMQDVSAALVGVDAVIMTLGIPLGPAMIFGPVRLFSDATRVILSAMHAGNVKRLICVTGFGAGDSRGSIGRLQAMGFRLIFGRAYDDKDIQELLIRQSHLEWVIARPGILSNGPKTERYRILEAPNTWRNGVISRADVADFLVKAVSENAYLRKTPVLIG